MDATSTLPPKHYVFLGGWRKLKYLYFDTPDYVADSLFYRKEIPVQFKDELLSPDKRYSAIFCKIPKAYKEVFESALEELPNKMFLTGHNDYLDFCYDLVSQMDED